MHATSEVMDLVVGISSFCPALEAALAPVGLIQVLKRIDCFSVTYLVGPQDKSSRTIKDRESQKAKFTQPINNQSIYKAGVGHTSNCRT